MKNYTLKIYKNNGKIEIIRTHKRKRFLKNLRTINWKSSIKKTYLKVSYGKNLCIYGCPCEFYNDGFCDNQEELLNIFKYFDDEE